MEHRRNLLLLTLLLFALSILVSCTSTEEQTRPSVQPPPPQPETPLSFRASTDTISTSHQEGEKSREPSQGDQGIRYMVQIGAFQNPLNAGAVQALARDRYHIPVLNDYHPALKLYQVRIGFFEDYETARVFRSKLILEHPADYRDAWIVQLAR